MYFTFCISTRISDHVHLQPGKGNSPKQREIGRVNRGKKITLLIPLLSIIDSRFPPRRYLSLFTPSVPPSREDKQQEQQERRTQRGAPERTTGDHVSRFHSHVTSAPPCCRKYPPPLVALLSDYTLIRAGHAVRTTAPAHRDNHALLAAPPPD